MSTFMINNKIQCSYEKLNENVRRRPHNYPARIDPGRDTVNAEQFYHVTIIERVDNRGNY